MLVAREVQRPRAGTCGDQEVRRRIRGRFDPQGVLAGEPSLAVQGVDTVTRQAGLHSVRNRVGEAVLVPDQIGPVDRQAGILDALAAKPAGTVDDLAPRRKIFFGSQPRNARVPPYGSASTIATLQPFAAHLFATAIPAMPAPITITS